VQACAALFGLDLVKQMGSSTFADITEDQSIIWQTFRFSLFSFALTFPV
jgi:hypothetical protein